MHNGNGLYRRTRAETAWIRHACASDDNAVQRDAVSRRFLEKKNRTPFLKVEMEGVREYVGKNLLPRIASPVATGRF